MLELTKENFEEEVLKAAGLVVVDYYGDGCVPCAALKPHYEAMAEKYADSFKFTVLNTSKARRVAIGQKILGLPVVAVYKDGEKLREVVKEEATPEAVEAMLVEIMNSELAWDDSCIHEHDVDCDCTLKINTE